MLPRISTPSRPQDAQVAPVFPATISRTATAASAIRKLTSTRAVRRPPTSAPDRTTRPASHSSVRPAQRLAVYRQAPGPVGNGGEQETCNRRCDITVQHLMDVPIECAELDRQPECAQEDRGIQTACRMRPTTAGGEEKWLATRTRTKPGPRSAVQAAVMDIGRLTCMLPRSNESICIIVETRHIATLRRP